MLFLAIGFGSDLVYRVVIGWRFDPVPNMEVAILEVAILSLIPKPIIRKGLSLKTIPHLISMDLVI